ncbi:ribosome biogenesis protein [archaeon]|nr:ribosome biogenesis protein [archaeon]|tara:strand:- start:131 stop:292 length:162 start_codon:yes stop_codon:yes gene_type:complete
MVEILQCPKCSEFTLKEVCSCGGKPINPLPPKAKLNDRWGKYRRQFKDEKPKI